MLAVCLTQVVNQYLIDGHYDGDIKRISGDSYDFTAFTKKQMQLYKHANELFLDRDVVKESDGELIELLKLYKEMYPNVRITVIYEEADENNPDFIIELLKAGIYNIVIGNEVDDINLEIDTCLSDSGMTAEYWVDKGEPYSDIPELLEVVKFNLMKKAKDTHIFVYSAQSRVGTTTCAINLAKYLKSLGTNVLVVDTLGRMAPVMMDKLMCDVYDDYYVYQDIHYSVSAAHSEDYNFVVHDCGTRLPQGEHSQSDYIVLVGRADISEIDNLATAIDKLTPDTVVLTAVPESLREDVVSAIPAAHVYCADIPDNYMFNSSEYDKNNESLYADITKQALDMLIELSEEQSDELEI